MPDYASILRRSISALPDPTPEMREVVYGRARAALARQLTAVDPPLSSREIENQHQELEDAVARLEADFAPDESEADPADDDQNVFYDAPPEEARSDYGDAYPPSMEVPPAHPADADYEDGDEEDDEGYDDEPAPRRTAVLVGLGVLAVVVLGLGAFGYAQRGALFGTGEPEQVAIGTATPPARTADPALPGEATDEPAEDPDLEAGASVDAPAPGRPDKRPDRLINGTEAPPVAEPAPADVAAADPLPPSEPAVPAGDPQSPGPVEALPAEPPPGLQGQQTAAVTEPGGSIVAQRAIYYFQGAEGTAGQATEGSVTWAQMSRESGPAIQATLRLGEREATTTVTIYRNTDPTLPASHLVEVNFAGGGLGPSRVQRVPALVMKQTEQARGQPLTGAAVPVTDDLFWIALSDDAEQVTRNLQLLREGSWFDIPILFEDGTRALLTFEKGIPGDKVFETVMAGWTPT